MTEEQLAVRSIDRAFGQPGARSMRARGANAPGANAPGMSALGPRAPSRQLAMTFVTTLGVW